MTNEVHNQFLHAFSGATNSLSLYPHQHPANVASQKNLWEALQRLWQLHQTITTGVVEQTLFINDQLYPNNSAAATIVSLLEKYQIEGIKITRELQQQELQRFMELFCHGKLSGENFTSILLQNNIHNISYAARDDSKSSDVSMARATYDQALTTIEQVGHSIEIGQIPSTTTLFPTVETMVRQTIKKPYAMMALSMIKNYDNYTYTHSVNVSVIALAIGRVCQLSKNELHTLGVGSLLHDLGKLKIDPTIIKKPGHLSPEEYQEIKMHPELGAQIARQMESIEPAMVDIILGHHIHYDRCGYPEHAATFSAPELIDITTVADTYDAITTLRAYRRPSTPRQAINVMRRLSGSQLHPRYMQALEQTLGSFPVGSLVRLFNNEIGLVVDMDEMNVEQSTVRIVKDSMGNDVDSPYDVQIDDSNTTIAGEVDPVVHNIDIAKTLASN